MVFYDEFRIEIVTHNLGFSNVLNRWSKAFQPCNLCSIAREKGDDTTWKNNDSVVRENHELVKNYRDV